MSTPDDVRDLALALPETIERSSYGTPGFRVGDRLFARLHQDGESLVVWVDMDEREMLAQTEPEKFFWTPHYEKHPMLQVRLAAVDRRSWRSCCGTPGGAGRPRRCFGGRLPKSVGASRRGE